MKTINKPDFIKAQSVIDEILKLDQSLQHIVNEEKRLINEVNNATNDLVEEIVNNKLSNIEIEYININKSRIRTSILKTAGINTILQARNCSYEKLIRIEGIGHQTANRIIHEASNIYEKTRYSSKFKIDPNSKSKNSNKLVEILNILLKSKTVRESINDLYFKEHDFIFKKIRDAKISYRRFNWFFSFKKSKESALHCLNELESLLNNEYKIKVLILTENYKNIASKAAINFWTEFENNSAAFYTILESITGQINEEVVESNVKIENSDCEKSIIARDIYKKKIETYADVPYFEFEIGEEVNENKSEKIKTHTNIETGLNYQKLLSLVIRERTFYKAGLVLVDCYDDSKNWNYVPFKMYYSQFKDMTAVQLKSYIIWRTKVRNGVIEPIDASYMFVYIYELLHLIGSKDEFEGFYRLLTFWEKARVIEPRVDNYLFKWVAGFISFYGINVEDCHHPFYLELIEQGSLTTQHPDFLATQNNDAKLLMNAIDSGNMTIVNDIIAKNGYNFKKGAFAKKDKNNILDKIVNHLTSEMLDKQRHMMKHLTVMSREYNNPFPGAIFEFHIEDLGKSIDIVAINKNFIEEYSREIEMLLDSQFEIPPRIKKRNREYLKRAELKFMKDTINEFVKANKLTIIPPVVEKTITKANKQVTPVESVAPQKLVIDIGSLKAIRENADKTAEKLVPYNLYKDYSEDKEQDSIVHANKLPIIPTMVEKTNVNKQLTPVEAVVPQNIAIDVESLKAIRETADKTAEKLVSENLYEDYSEGKEQEAIIIERDELFENSWEEFVNNLSENSYAILTLIANNCEYNQVLSYALNNFLMFEEEIDKINETALNIIGDTLLESDINTITVFEDYRNDVLEIINKETRKEVKI